jgi:hypothetical protein
LDLTTDSHSYAAYVYASPTVVDLNGDGALDILLGTAAGYIHRINSKGELSRGVFPLIMDSIAAQIVAEDLNGDGKLGIDSSELPSLNIIYLIPSFHCFVSLLNGMHRDHRL